MSGGSVSERIAGDHPLFSVSLYEIVFYKLANLIQLRVGDGLVMVNQPL